MELMISIIVNQSGLSSSDSSLRIIDERCREILARTSFIVLGITTSVTEINWQLHDRAGLSLYDEAN